MRTTIQFISTCMLLIFFFVACSDIIEPEISGKRINILAPTSGAVIKGNKVVFSWDPIAGASQYHIQIASPSFTDASGILVDTLNLTNSFSSTLEKGDYEWRIRAENSAYATDYRYIPFKVDSSGNIEDYKLELSSPENNLRTNSEEITFSWEPLEQAAYYLFESVGKESSFSGRVDGESSITLTFDKVDDVVEWRVFAVKEDLSTTSSGAYRKLFIDHTAPVITSIVRPVEGENEFLAGQVVAFEWSPVEDVDGDFKEYRVRLSRMEGENKVEMGQGLSFTDFNQSSLTSADLLGEGEELGVGAYLWELETVDSLGNNDLREVPFTVNEEAVGL